MAIRKWIKDNNAVNIGTFRTFGDVYNIVVCSCGTGFVFGKLYNIGACGLHFAVQGFEVFNNEQSAILAACKYVGIK